jgi:hypothetical protein
MRNILLVQLETKVALSIILIAVIIFLITLFKSIDDFNKFIEQLNIRGAQYEEIRIQKNP